MLIIDKDTQIPLYEQLYDQLREQILSGSIPECSSLPSTRSLAKTLHVSRNTVESAYLQLYSEGYISSKARSGYRVEKIESQHLKRVSVKRADGFEKQSESAHEQGLPMSPGINFQYGRLRASDFPLQIFRKLINRMLLSSEADKFSTYSDRKGDPDLRAEIGKYIYESRGVRCQPEQIILCSGILSCLGLLSQLFLGNRNCVALEEPCYDTIRSLFANHRFDIVSIPVEKYGIDPDRLEQTSAKAVYVTPSHQFPTGVVMPVNKRLGLIEWAERNDAYIIEDDYDSELRYSSRPIPSMQSLDSKDRVVYLNTFSKSLAPGLRISFMVLPLPLLEEYQRRFSRYNCSVPWLEQKVLYEFMKEGHWNRHLRRINVSNKKRHDALINAITETMGAQVTIYGKNAGLHIILEVRNGMTEKELIEEACAAGVTVYPVSIHYADQRNNTGSKVLIGFSSLSEEDIAKGIRILKTAWFS